MVNDRGFIFHMCIPSGKTYSLVPRSRSGIQVKKLAFSGTLVFHKHSVFVMWHRIKALFPKTNVVHIEEIVFYSKPDNMSAFNFRLNEYF